MLRCQAGCCSCCSKGRILLATDPILSEIEGKDRPVSGKGKISVPENQKFIEI